MVTQMGRELISCFHSMSQEGGAPALPNFWVPLYLCLHPSTWNDEFGVVTW